MMTAEGVRPLQGQGLEATPPQMVNLLEGIVQQPIWLSPHAYYHNEPPCP